MTEQQFQHAIGAAETFQRLAERPEVADFWAGYIRGTRCLYHGEKFGTACYAGRAKADKKGEGIMKTKLNDGMKQLVARRPAMKNRRLFYAVVILALSFMPSTFAQAFEGKVVSISDGDTISVMNQGAAVKIRLNGIDCPESGQPFAAKARQFISELAFGQTVTVHEHGKDKYGRVIGEIILPDGRSVNQEMVRAGLAWWYKEYSNDKELAILEEEA